MVEAPLSSSVSAGPKAVLPLKSLQLIGTEKSFSAVLGSSSEPERIKLSVTLATVKVYVGTSKVTTF